MHVPTDTAYAGAWTPGPMPLDTEAESVCKELAELAAAALQAPLVVVSLLAEDGCWLKSSYGAGIASLPNHDTWCALALQSEKPVEIPDLRSDPRLTLDAGLAGMRFLVAKALRSAAGRPIGVLAVLDDAPRRLDIVEHRALDIIARQIVARLDGEYREIDDDYGTAEREAQDVRNFVDVVSHDLRAPLVNVLGFTDELQRSAEELRSIFGEHKANCPLGLYEQLEEVLKEHIDPSLICIRSSAARMSEQVKALLELSRAERQVLNVDEVDLGELLGEVVSSHAIELQRADASVDIEPLGSISTDREILHHVFENLIDNAVKFRCRKHPLVVDVSIDSDSSGVVVHVSDTGRGIGPADVARIFDMFQRAGPNDTPGAGVGLCHTRTLVRKLGGNIWCDSVPGQGSTFHVGLPWSIGVPPREDAGGQARLRRGSASR